MRLFVRTYLDEDIEGGINMQDENESNREEGDNDYTVDDSSDDSDWAYRKTLIKYLLFLALFITVIVVVSKIAG